MKNILSLEQDMDDIDKKLLNILQKEFPLTERPFLAVAEKCGLSEEEVINRVQKLKDAGIIRRIGAVFSGSHLDRVSTLCAARVPEEKLDDFVRNKTNQVKSIRNENQMQSLYTKISNYYKK